MRRAFIGLVTLVAVLSLVLPGRAQLIKQKTELPEWFRKQLHRWEDYKVLIIKGGNPTPDVDKLVANPEAYRLVAWQVSPEHTKESDVKRLLQWVSEGGTLWFQDSRLGAMLGGFESAPLGGTDVPPQGFKTALKPYGDGKIDGANMFGVANPCGGHPVLAGVDYVQVFAIKVGEAPGRDGAPGAMYSAVRRTPDVTPLLRVDPTSNTPLSDRLVAAVKSYGDGAIVFKPLIWEEQYTGGRFQYNLLEWSSGFGVPDMTASGPSGQKPRRRATGSTTSTPSSSAALDQVTFVDKHVIDGIIQTKEMELTVFEPVLTKTKLSFDKVRSVVMQSDGMRDAVTLKDGRRVLGSVSFPDDLAIRTATGQQHKVKKSEILRITVHEAPGASDKKGN